MSNVTKIVVRNVRQEWVAVTGPHMCVCGHTHHGRELFENGALSNLAPQYSICDSDICPCTVLRRDVVV